MRTQVTVALLAAAAIPTIARAQVQLSVRTAAESGIAWQLPGGAHQVQTFAANTTFATNQALTLIAGSPLPIFPGAARMDHSVSPPGPPLPGPLGHVLDRVVITDSVRVTDGAVPVALHTTASAAGTPGMQRYDVMLAGNTLALVTVRFVTTVYDHATVSVRVTGGGINQLWAQNTAGHLDDALQAQVPVNGTTTLLVEVTGVVTPGPGQLLWDGFDANVTISAHDIGAAAFTVSGTGCGGTISGSGVPIVNQNYTVNLDGAPAHTLALLIAGDSNTNFGILSLPVPLAYMGAGGCFLNVAANVTLAHTTDAAGHAEATFLLPASALQPKIHLQWAVLDPAANPAGLTTTSGAELRW